MVKKKIIIKGKRVQNVGYRLRLLEQADEFGISHLNIKNIDELDKDQKQIVEVFVGEDDDAIIGFIAHIKKKNNYPKNAIVESIEVVDEDYQGNIITTESFSMRLTNSQLYKMTEIGNTMIDTQQKTIGEIIDLKNDLKSQFDKRFETLEEDVLLIKKKMCMI
jgi:acylphosphatase